MQRILAVSEVIFFFAYLRLFIVTPMGSNHVTLTSFSGPVLSDRCPEGEGQTLFDAREESNPSVFDDLTMTEILAVQEYLYRQEDLNLKRSFDDVTIDSSYIYLIERLDIPKREVLGYLEHEGPKPERHAKAILYRLVYTHLINCYYVLYLN